MKDAIHNYCRLGIVLSMAYPECSASEDAYLASLKKILVDPFFQVVELGSLPFPSLEAKVPPMVRTAHCDATFSGHSLLFSQKLNINSLDEEERQKAVSLLKKGIDQAYSWGCEEFQFLSRGYEVGKEEAYLQQLILSTSELCSYAQMQGSMAVCLEVFDHTIDKKSLLGPAPLVRRYAQEVCRKHKNFGIMVDCSHIPMIGETIDEAIDPVRQYIRHVHVGNTLISDPNHPSYGDNHPRFGYPGSENDTNYLASFLQKVKDIGYLKEGGENILSFEVKPQGGEDSDLVVANAKRTLLDAWKRVR
ncbi:TIM barrel protein [Sphaerochaeta sp. PS]|uniref:sugar phosphate isomerase/epimerase family protein n=1 Tax=Sphaerochaeta sp. PS TaxID=3076336 RepID=UPI0028A4A73F|nr:TIM barrel protein [Sphaerochaeta sp. PS]MDT4762998.1 TIM barrel protein [Sphaerochaeta sp. PS]